MLSCIALALMVVFAISLGLASKALFCVAVKLAKRRNKIIPPYHVTLPEERGHPREYWLKRQLCCTFKTSCGKCPKWKKCMDKFVKESRITLSGDSLIGITLPAKKSGGDKK